MSDSTSNLSSIFAKFYHSIILSRPWLILFLLAAITALAGFYAQNYKVDASADALVLEGDEDLAFFREVSKRYAAEEFFIVAYQPKTYLFADETLENLSQLVSDLETIDGVSTVMSILDVPLLYSPRVSIGGLIAGVKTLRDEGVDRDLVAEEFRNSPIYKQLLSSTDAKTTALQVGLVRDQTYNRLLDERDRLRVLNAAGDLSKADTDSLILAEQVFKDYTVQSAERQRQLVENVRAVLDQHRTAATAIFLGGVPMIASDMVSFVKSDLQVFGIGILLFVIVVLTVIFRSFRWVFLPLLVCVLTNIFMLGLLGFLDWRMTVISSNFIALLLIITLAIAVHLVVRYRELQLLRPQATQHELALATVTAMLRPCLYTGLTTIVAFMSLVISGIRPVMDFGWMMTIGVLVALLTTFIVVPVGMILGRAPTPEVKKQSSSDESIFTLRFACITENHGGKILAAAVFILLFSISGVMQLKVENRFIDYFDEATEIYRGMELVDSELGGTIPLELVVYPAAEQAIDDDDSFDEFDDEFGDEFGESSSEISPWFTIAGLNELDRIHQYMDGLTETGKVLSLATVYQLAQDLLGGGLDDIQLALAYRNLPAEIKEVMITPYLYDEINEARITVRVKETSRTLNRAELLADLDRFMQEDMGYSEDRYRFTGMLVLYNNLLQSLFVSQILTLGLVFVAITAMLVVLFQSFNLALIGIVPNLMAALLVLGGMGWAGVPLDMMTITIAAISIGIGVDNTIHYVHRFKREFQHDGDYIATMYRCHASIGRAMYYTSITIIFGFSILALSNFKPSIYFGLLTGVAMLSALLGSLLLLPKLLLLFKPLGTIQARE
ncbi:MMPL family transporter [Pseudomonadales bacterium]|nr:MMPL family transporter [Pseudomonadales bacterium]